MSDAQRSLTYNRFKPAAAPKPRGKSPGRKLGQSPTVRPRFSVVKKGKSRTPQTEIAA